MHPRFHPPEIVKPDIYSDVALHIATIISGKVPNIEIKTSTFNLRCFVFLIYRVVTKRPILKNEFGDDIPALQDLNFETITSYVNGNLPELKQLVTLCNSKLFNNARDMQSSLFRQALIYKKFEPKNLDELFANALNLSGIQGLEAFLNSDTQLNYDFLETLKLVGNAFRVHDGPVQTIVQIATHLDAELFISTLHKIINISNYNKVLDSAISLGKLLTVLEKTPVREWNNKIDEAIIVYYKHRSRSSLTATFLERMKLSFVDFGLNSSDLLQVESQKLTYRGFTDRVRINYLDLDRYRPAESLTQLYPDTFVHYFEDMRLEGDPNLYQPTTYFVDRSLGTEGKSVLGEEKFKQVEDDLKILLTFLNHDLTMHAFGIVGGEKTAEVLRRVLPDQEDIFTKTGTPAFEQIATSFHRYLMEQLFLLRPEVKRLFIQKTKKCLKTILESELSGEMKRKYLSLFQYAFFHLISPESVESEEICNIYPEFKDTSDSKFALSYWYDVAHQNSYRVRKEGNYFLSIEELFQEVFLKPELDHRGVDSIVAEILSKARAEY